MKSILSIVFGLLAITKALASDGVIPPLNNAEDALAYFKESSIPSLENINRGAESNRVTAIRKATLTIRCYSVTPTNIEKFAGSHGVRWPDNGYPILSGSVEQVKSSGTNTWVINYSTGITGTLYAYLDSATGKILLAFIIPEG